MVREAKRDSQNMRSTLTTKLVDKNTINLQ